MDKYPLNLSEAYYRLRESPFFRAKKNRIYIMEDIEMRTNRLSIELLFMVKHR